jgi:predicted permease
MPAAIHTFVIAHSMGMDYEYAGKIVTLSTALSVFTLPIWVWLLGV